MPSSLMSVEAVSGTTIAQQFAVVKKMLMERNFASARKILHVIARTEKLGAAQYGVLAGLADELVKYVAPSDVFRVAILSTYTTQPIATAVRCAFLSEGIIADVYEAPFAAYIQEILSPESGLYEYRPDMVVIAVGASEAQSHFEGAVTDDAIQQALEKHTVHWQKLWETLNLRLGKPVLQHVSEVPEEEFLGIAERRAKWSPSRIAELANSGLINSSPSLVRWVDVDRLAARVGRENWHDQRLSHHGKYGFSPRFLRDYTVLLTAAVRGALGKTPKALILDLDNTLWGGVIGDDGLEGIRLGVDTPEGEAYLAFCRYVKRLGQRGVILGICSKNEFSIATEVFKSHPQMPLRLEDFAVISCNWDDKASNLQKLAEELNIDISTMVFLDDNPAECELVRQALPKVMTINMDGDPALFARKLDQLHLFDLQEFSDVDMKRTASYQARAMSSRLKIAATDFDGYLVSLEMFGEVWVARQEDVSRLAQMEAKTNQFNLTTRRWNAEHIQAFMASPDHDVLCFRLKDRFADHGLVGSVIVSYQMGEACILSWLLSCRVFSRTCEEFILEKLVRRAKDRGVHLITGEYVASEKNSVVANLYLRLGFVEKNKEAFVLHLLFKKNLKTLISHGIAS